MDQPKSIKTIADLLARRLAFKVSFYITLVVLPLVLVGTIFFEHQRLVHAFKATEGNFDNSILTGDRFQVERLAGSLVSGGLVDGVTILDANQTLILGSSGFQFQKYKNGLHILDKTLFYGKAFALDRSYAGKIGTAFFLIRVSLYPITIALFVIFCFSVLLRLYSLRLFRNFSWKIIEPITNFPELLKSDRMPSSWEIIEFKELFQEISSLRRNEMELKEKQTLFSVSTQVAHDIRSPLSSMQAALEYLGKMKIADPKAPDVLNLLELSSNRLTRIADGLLKKNKGQEDDKILFNLHKVLDELIGEFQAREEFQVMKFTKNYISQAVQLVGDRSKLQRAFGNIIKNAVEAMQGKGVMAIGTSLEQGNVTVRLADTGPGMDREKLEKVLQGGFTEGKKDGHGIGTKVVRETVNEFQGVLTAESEVGKGTTFIISLPLPSEELKATAEKEKELIEQLTIVIPAKAGIQNNRSPAYAGDDKMAEPVLVIDDDPSLREQWRMVLHDHGIETILFESYENLLQNRDVMTKTKTAIVDYTFHNSKMNGENIIRYLQTKGFNNLTLCTAEYFRPDIHRLAKELGVALCPKPLPRIQVEIAPSPQPSPIKGEGGNPPRLTEAPAKQANPPLPKGGFTVLVIDDDKGIRVTWEFQQEILKIAKLYAYANLEALQSNGINLDTVDIAFVDKNIENSQFSGAQVIDFLKAKGIRKVVVASGEDAAVLKADPQFAKADYILNEKIPSPTLFGELTS